ncbi:MAG: S8 family serine peptidase [Planctomycetes bacterium]|nr:S8 family serine peptidase [Planctomycetota bacterium]MBI3847170.1 S8 family serine peptidase [Planctomycetota bacterium]
MSEAPSTKPCSLCGKETSASTLAEAAWHPSEVIERFSRQNPRWRRGDGACPACVQQILLEALLERGEAALHQGIQSVWPIDPEAAFGALPTPLRLHADPRYNGAGVTIALVDSAFYPHPDLVESRNRIRAWVDVSGRRLRTRRFENDETPRWPGWDHAADVQWHGLMTSVAASGDGALSHGLYRGLASNADLVLVQAMNSKGRVPNATIVRALEWLLHHGPLLGVRIVSLSLGGDPVATLRGNAVDEAVRRLVEKGIVVVVAAGNAGERRLLPPATSPFAITVGGLDDKNTFDHAEREVWHSNYGETVEGALKPELVAPSLWVVAPVLPGTPVAKEAADLFARRAKRDAADARAPAPIDSRIAELKLVTPHYQHVEGTSFAAPLVSSVVACMIQANPSLGPRRIRELLVAGAHPVTGASVERQGAGAVDAGKAVTLALADRHSRKADFTRSPLVTPAHVTFYLHDHRAHQVQVLGSWNDWKAPGLVAEEVEPGLWQALLRRPAAGEYAYRFLIDGIQWLTDPANPARVPDGAGRWNSLLQVE